MTSSELDVKYDAAAPAWGDKMRLLGYHDAYLGFLASETERASSGMRVLDVGCGTGAFSEGWVAIHGPTQNVTLLDPSREMVRRAQGALAQKGASADVAACSLENFTPESRFDYLLAAHVIEHQDDPTRILAQMRDVTTIGGRLWLIVSKPHWCNAIIWLQWRHKAYHPAEVAASLKDSGWALEKEYAFPSGPPSRTSRGYLARAI